VTSTTDAAGSAVVRALAILVLALMGTAVTACQSAGGVMSPAAVAVSSDAISAERQAWAQNASWAPGQLEEHFRKHGREGPYASAVEYDRAARDTVVNGILFTYVDRESRAQRLGFYHSSTNRFTSLTADGQRITTFFHPERRDSYVRGLDRSTYK
jgi:pyocin large subunit-like protein